MFKFETTLVFNPVGTPKFVQCEKTLQGIDAGLNNFKCKTPLAFNSASIPKICLV